MNFYHKLLNKIDWTFNVFMSKKHKKDIRIQVMNFEESLNYLIDSKCSLSRFGDGEFTLMLNGEFLCPRNISLKFQAADPRLKERMLQILKDKNLEKYNLKLAIPRSLVNPDKEQLTDSAFWFWENYLHELAYKVFAMINPSHKYLDSQISRFYMDFQNKDPYIMQEKVKLWKKLWDKEDLLIIEGEDSNLGMNNDLYNNCNSISRIKCPNSNAFNQYDQIFEVARSFGKNKLILIALGPTATVLAYDLAKAGYRAIDLGHLDIKYHWFLMGATEKVPVKGKRMTEVENSNDSNEEFENNNIKKEILYRIKVNREISTQ